MKRLFFQHSYNLSDISLGKAYFVKENEAAFRNKYIYEIDLFNNSKSDSVVVKFPEVEQFKVFTNGNTKNEMSWIKRMGSYMDSYYLMPAKYRRKLFDRAKGGKSYPQDTKMELVQSVYNSLIDSNYNYLLTKLVMYEQFEIKEIIRRVKHDTASSDSLFFGEEYKAEAIKALNIFINKFDQVEFEWNRNVVIAHLPDGYVFHLVNRKDKWYLVSTFYKTEEKSKFLLMNEYLSGDIKTEKLPVINIKIDRSDNAKDKDEQLFYVEKRQKYKLLSKKYSKKFFGEVLADDDKYPQGSVNTLVNTLNKAYANNDIGYMCSCLFAYEDNIYKDQIDKYKETGECAFIDIAEKYKKNFDSFINAIIDPYADNSVEFVYDDDIVQAKTPDGSIFTFVKRDNKWYLSATYYVVRRY